jgi:hypothetical protein
MGLFRRLRSIGSRIFRGVGRVAGFASKALNFIQKPLSFIQKPLQGLMDKALGKLPFGIGKFIKPFADKFLSQGLGMVLGGPLGGLTSLASKIPNFDGIKKIVDTVDQVANGGVGGIKGLLPEGKANLLEMVTQQHARFLQ